MTGLFLALAVVVAQPELPARPSFAEWLEGVKKEALTRGIREDIVTSALASVEEPVPVVIERDRAQAESVLSLEQYIARLLTPRMIRTGREKYAANRELLEQVAAKYGVPARIIGGIWGVESNFGRFSGVRPTIPALATLAWDPRRATFFRGELFDALEILNRGDIDLPDMKGSWAGAMGQVQFMPSSYLKYAEDFDGDGRRDIWADVGDIFASVANYLKGHGWVEGQSWGREVAVSADALRRIRNDVAPRTGSCRARRDMTSAMPLRRWRELGVTLPGGKALPVAELEASLVSGARRHFLVYGNYDALLEYNCAHSYAISVALLGDAIASTSTSSSTLPKAQPAARRKARRKP